MVPSDTQGYQSMMFYKDQAVPEISHSGETSRQVLKEKPLQEMCF